jgi:hypothetical protein
MDDESGGLLDESTQARDARTVFCPRGLARLMRALDLDPALESRINQVAAIAYPAFIPPATEATACVDPAELSRFEGEGGPEPPEPDS